MLWNRTFERSKNCFVWSELKLFVQFAVFPFWCSIFAQIECFFFFLFGSIKWEDGQAQGQTEQDLFWNSFLFSFYQIAFKMVFNGLCPVSFLFSFFQLFEVNECLRKRPINEYRDYNGLFRCCKTTALSTFPTLPFIIFNVSKNRNR